AGDNDRLARHRESRSPGARCFRCRLSSRNPAAHCIGGADLAGLFRDSMSRGVDAMETEGTLSAAQVLSPTQPTDEPSRRTVDATREQDAVSEFRLLIGGKLVEGAGPLDGINPAAGRVLTPAARADRGQLEQAVAAAKAAFPAWSETPLRVRAALLVRLAEALEAEQGAFARLLTQEQGK